MDANDLLMGGGVKSAAFPDQQYGHTVGGVIVRPPQVRQQTDFDSGKPKFFDNGDPMMQIVVQVQTDLRDPNDSTDDGVRAFYLKGQMQAAVRDAVREAGAKGLEVGGTLHVRYLRDEPNSRGRGKDKKVYAAKYTAPAARPPTTRSWAATRRCTPRRPPRCRTCLGVLAQLSPEQQQALLAQPASSLQHGPAVLSRAFSVAHQPREGGWWAAPEPRTHETFRPDEEPENT
jgi:hypothetical protein